MGTWANWPQTLGIGQEDSANRHIYAKVMSFGGDKDGEIRAQVARVLGDCKVNSADDLLSNMLEDLEPRIRFFAAVGLSRLYLIQKGKLEPMIGRIVELLRTNDDKDPFLRHAGVMALASLGSLDTLKSLASDPSSAVRRAVVVAMRRRQFAAISRFLKDKDPSIVLESARAINDVPIPAAQSALADLIHGPIDSVPLGYRVLNANFREGQSANASAVAEFAVARTRRCLCVWRPYAN